MRFSGIQLTNFRSAGQDAPPLLPGDGLTLLLGNNGCDKSVVLDAMALALAPFVAEMTGMEAAPLQENDLHRDSENFRASRLSIRASFILPGGSLIDSVRSLDTESPATASDSEALRGYARSLLADPDAVFPVIASYGTERAHISAFSASGYCARGRQSCYCGALDAGVSGFLDRFTGLDSEERTKSSGLRDSGFRLPALQALRRAIAGIAGDRYCNPRIDPASRSLILTERSGICRDREIPFSRLSHGYRIMTALAGDIAMRMAVANPQLSDPLQSPGIVLVDEIDLHLHPLWQRTVAAALRSLFPRVQFIFSTHSPLVVAGASSFARIIHLADGNPGEFVPDRDPAGMDVAQLLLSDLFGLESLHSPIWDAKLRRRRELLALDAPDAAQTSELMALDRELDGLTSAASHAGIRTDILLERIAASLNIKL